MEERGNKQEECATRVGEEGRVRAHPRKEK
jgi:hypothetical protein